MRGEGALKPAIGYEEFLAALEGIPVRLVPWSKAELEEPVEHSRRHPRQVQRGRAGTTEILEPLQAPSEHVQVARDPILATEGESRAHNGLLRVPFGDTQG